MNHLEDVLNNIDQSGIILAREMIGQEQKKLKEKEFFLEVIFLADYLQDFVVKNNLAKTYLKIFVGTDDHFHFGTLDGNLQGILNNNDYFEKLGLGEQFIPFFSEIKNTLNAIPLIEHDNKYIEGTVVIELNETVAEKVRNHFFTKSMMATYKYKLLDKEMEPSYSMKSVSKKAKL